MVFATKFTLEYHSGREHRRWLLGDHQAPADILTQGYSRQRYNTNHSHHDSRSTQTAAPRFRDYSPGGIPRPTMARFCGADLVVRREEGELDGSSTHAHPDKATYARGSAKVNQAPSSTSVPESLIRHAAIGSAPLHHCSRITPPSKVRVESGFPPRQQTS